MPCRVISSAGPVPATRFPSGEAGTSLAHHPFAARSPAPASSDSSSGGSPDIRMVIRVRTTVGEMSLEAEWLQSSLEAAEVALAAPEHFGRLV